MHYGECRSVFIIPLAPIKGLPRGILNIIRFKILDIWLDLP